MRRKRVHTAVVFIINIIVRSLNFRSQQKNYLLININLSLLLFHSLGKEGFFFGGGGYKDGFINQFFAHASKSVADCITDAERSA